MKKICIVTTRFDPDIGGTELLSKSISYFFHDKEYSLEVITTPSTENRNFSNYPFKIYEVNFIHDHYEFNRIIKSNNYDICLFICDLHSPCLNLYDLSCKNNFCILNLDERTYEMKQNFYKATDNLKKFNLVFTFTKNSVSNKFLEENKINNFYIQNFSRDILQTKLDEPFKNKIKSLFNNESKVILYPASFEERKNQKYLLNLLNGSSSLREFNWLFVGSISDKRYLEECIFLSDKNKLNAKFIKASKDTSYIDKIYQCCDAIFLGSIAEGMPLVIIEALSANKPWICTDVGGVKGVVGSSNTGEIIKINYTEHDAYSAIKNSLEKEMNYRTYWQENFDIKKVLEIYHTKLQEEYNDNI